MSAGASVLQKGESKDILITFMPKDIVQYVETVPFEINGLYTVPFTVTGEGTIPRVELLNPSHKVGAPLPPAPEGPNSPLGLSVLGGLARGHGVGLFAFGGAYWTLARAHSGSLWV